MAETCGERMVPGTDVSANSMYKCCNGKVSGMDQDQIQNEEILEHSNQLSAAKPLRNLATMRHCSSSAWLSESVSIVHFVFFFSCQLGMNKNHWCYQIRKKKMYLDLGGRMRFPLSV
ncbi:hypothetical protein ACOSP7_022463 [Xanthoceras sorbifolium]